MPFRADNMVRDIEAQVEQRAAARDESPLRRAADALAEAADALEGDARERVVAAAREASAREASSRNAEWSAAAFELGRCRELIDAYRRLEFDSGTRRGRFTGYKRKNIGNRILSRLFH